MRRIWQWFKSWFQSNSVGEDDYSVSLYKPIERNIYRHSDGQKIVTKDPLILHKRINNKMHELRADMQAAGSDWKFKEKCHNDLLNNIRYIFDVKPLDQGGLTEQETLDLLDHYLTYESFQKKIANLSPTTVQAPSSSPQPSSAGDSVTKNTTGSSSTKSEPSTDKSPSSPTEPESPSGSSSPDSNTSAP